MPIKPAIAVDRVVMPGSRKDPAGRLIVATARHHNRPSLTTDEKILGYAAAG